MDRSWMYLAPRASLTYVNGVESFLDFAFLKSARHGMILCPCIACHNRFLKNRAEVSNHLICSGFQKGYSEWTDHGESRKGSSSSIKANGVEGNYQNEMHGLLHDLFPRFSMEGSNQDIGERELADNLDMPPIPEINVDPVLNEQQKKNNDDKRKFDDLLKDVEQKVYPDAKHNKLSCLVHLYHIKCLNGWSNKSFSMLLEFLHDLLPEGNILPKKNYQVKKIMAKLGLGYEKIHACINGCMLFWKDTEKDQSCSVCGASRWKPIPTEDNEDDNSEDVVTPKKNKAMNILRWFPLKPRLQRLFMSSKTTTLMKWHHMERVRDGKLRHPADALAWKHFDERYPGFASDPRNVRLGLASDGFNPYRTMSVSYSIWPVFVIPYNLPPWYIMKQPNFILSLIIPGPKGPGNKIDVYMQPLINELKDLWDTGIETFDSSVNENFCMKAALLSTISDFPGYANLSGWSTKGEYACPLCAFDKTSKWLDHGRKWCYMGHRKWLQADHHSRRDTRSFDGHVELGYPPIPLSGDAVLDQLQGVDFLVESVETGPWKKKSIFFKLPYWKNLLLRHNLDVMHIEKNVCDNFVGTLLGQVGKSKDNLNARLDLKKKGIREELHPKNHPRSNNMYILPKACYEMSRVEKDAFLKTLKSIKPPDEYSSNVSRCVQLKERKLMGMKSYDCHMLMQEYLPIALRGTLPDHVSLIIIELCDFFRRICLKDLGEADLKFLESRVSITLCKLEQIFPPSFFTVMVHLVIHLVREIRLGGPVTFRWMYPIERDLHTLKSYVNNKAYPEGSIAEGYLARESLTFCSRYLSGVETLFTRPIRNDDDDDQNEIEESNFLCPGRPLGQHEHSQLSCKRKRFPKCQIDEKSLKQAHRYVLFNVNSITPFQEEHKRLVKGQYRARRLPEYELQKIHSQNFAEWFKKRVTRLEEQKDPRVTEEVKWLARGPNNFVKRYSGYLVKGYRFHTKDHEKLLKTQNSGVVVNVVDPSTQRVANYYGRLTDIVRLNYSGKLRVVLFKCDWVDIDKGCKTDEFGVKLVNFSYLIHKGDNLLDDPFVLASQVDKVFYTHDLKLEDWMVARHVKVKDAFNMQCDTDENILSSLPHSNDVPNLHRVGVDVDDGVDGTLVMESQEVEDDENEQE